MVSHQLQVERRTGKVRQSETDVLPLCLLRHQLYCVEQRLFFRIFCLATPIARRTAILRIFWTPQHSRPLPLEVIPLNFSYGVWGIAVSSPTNGLWDGAAAEIGLWCIVALKSGIRRQQFQ